jgi:urea transporter
VYALLAAAFSVFAFAGIAVLLSPIGMPALTAPFVITTWLFLLPKAAFRALDPVALAEVSTAERARSAHLASRAQRPAGPAPGTT